MARLIYSAITSLDGDTGRWKRVNPHDIRLDLELLAERRFGNGMVHLRYRTRS
jgi:hypothetical protein